MYLLASRRTFLSRNSFSCSRRSISEINSSKRFESCPSAASTQSRIQRSRFSASILPSAVRWQQRRANLLERLLLAPLIQNQGQTLFAKFLGRRTLQRIFAANNFRDVRNERTCSKHRHNPTESLISRMDRKPKHDWSLLVPCILIAISLLGFVYLVWDRLH